MKVSDFIRRMHVGERVGSSRNPMLTIDRKQAGHMMRLGEFGTDENSDVVYYMDGEKINPDQAVSLASSMMGVR